MNWINNIIEILDMISNGIDPSTGEIIDIEELKKDSAFQSSLKKLILTCGKTRSGSTYTQFETAYPNHAVIMTEGYFFAAHNKSAFVLNRILGYKIAVDFYKRPTTGGPNYEKIAAAFQGEGISYILVSKGELKEQVDGNDPFEKFGIKDSDCDMFVSDEMSEYASEENKKELQQDKRFQPSNYPRNLLKEVISDQNELPADVKDRLEAVLASERIFTPRYLRDAECLRKHFEDGRTLEDIGNDYGITRERVRQIIKRGIRKLHRKAVLSYLTGETETLEFAQHTATAGGNNLALDSILPLSKEAISISELARRLSAHILNEDKLRYADVSSWLVAAGDLVSVEDGAAIIMIPTSQGNEHGIKRGKRTNAAGIEYIGVFLEPSAQAYIADNLDSILAFRREDETEC